MSSRKILPPPDTSGVLSRRFSMDADPAAPSHEPPASLQAPAVADVAPNPRNPRTLTTRRARKKITEIANSLREHGQLQPCAVVTREAFLEIFGEYAAVVGTATYVQVNGGRRRAALIEANIPTIKVDVNDGLAASRAKFLAATAAENTEQDPLDPIEEATAVEDLLKECGDSQKLVAQQLNRTPAWVTQRRNLRRLAPEVQDALRADPDEEPRLPLRDVRDWHRESHEEQLVRLAAWRRRRALLDLAPQVREALQAASEEDQIPLDELLDMRHMPEEEQLAALDAWRLGRAADGLTAVNRDASDEPPPSPAARVPHQRPSPAAVAIRRLGATPGESTLSMSKIAAALSAELSADDLKDLIQQALLALLARTASSGGPAGAEDMKAFVEELLRQA